MWIVILAIVRNRGGVRVGCVVCHINDGCAYLCGVGVGVMWVAAVVGAAKEKRKSGRKKLGGREKVGETAFLLVLCAGLREG